MFSLDDVRAFSSFQFLNTVGWVTIPKAEVLFWWTIKTNSRKKCQLNEICSCIDMQTHAGRSRGWGSGFDLWPFDLRVSACQGPVMDCMSTDLGADSSAVFLQNKDRQTDILLYTA